MCDSIEVKMSSVWWHHLRLVFFEKWCNRRRSTWRLDMINHHKTLCVSVRMCASIPMQKSNQSKTLRSDIVYLGDNTLRCLVLFCFVLSWQRHKYLHTVVSIQVLQYLLFFLKLQTKYQKQDVENTYRTTTWCLKRKWYLNRMDGNAFECLLSFSMVSNEHKIRLWR